MMTGQKVYVVKHYVESYVLGVFDSEEKAKAAIAAAREGDPEDFEYHEYEMNVSEE